MNYEVSEHKYLLKWCLKVSESRPIYGFNSEMKQFEHQDTSVWDFPERGSWATHSGGYRGNWSPYVPRNLIMRYSSEGDVVLDPFVGSGTTLIECKLLKRIGFGLDINPKSVQLTKANLEFDVENSFKGRVICEDARKMAKVPSHVIDLICAHPPYGDIIHYSEGIKGDISTINIDKFKDEMNLVAKECFRILKNNKYCAVMIGDARRNGMYYSLSNDVLNSYLEAGFELKETIIKVQHNCKGTKKWEKYRNRKFLLLKHEYIYVFRKTGG